MAALVLGLAPGSPARAVDLTTLIVTYDAPPTSGQLDVLSGVTDAVHGFRAVPAAVVVAPVAAAPLLRELPGVRGVYPNTQYRWLSTGDLATGSSRASSVWQDLGWTGAGVGVGIIDAGVDGSHPDLCAAATFCKGTPVKTVQNVKVIGRQDVSTDPVAYLENQISTDSSSGHGSHVAGIAAGWGSAGDDPTRYRGVAYGADLVGFGTGELVEAVNVLGAFDYAISHRDKYNLKVLNNSWGTGAFTAYDPNDPVNLAIDTATADGISVVFGAGNDGTRTDSLNMFAQNPNVITVGSGTKDHQQSFFSAKGVPGSNTNRPTVTAPGDSIVSVRATTGFTIDAADAQTVGGGDADTPTSTNDQKYYATSSGTSMAAPHVTGVVALMQQAAHARLGRWLAPREVKNILQNTATPMPGYQTYSVGAGFVNAYAATQAAAAGAQTKGWVDPSAYDVTPYAGTISTGTVVGTTSFTSTHVVRDGATTLDVMADWGPEKVLPANTDVDIDLLRPDGTTFATTFLACDPHAQPNGYSSYCTSAPNERLTVVNPVPGTWTVRVHSGAVTADESVRGLWSVGYPRGTTLPGTASPATVKLDAGTLTTDLAGQSVAVSATVRDAGGLPLPNVPVTWSARGVGTLSPGTTVTNSFGRVVATATSPGPGTQTLTAAAGGLTSSVTLTWVGVKVPDLPCLAGCTTVVDSNGRASVGGWYAVNGTKHRIAATGQHSGGSTTSSGELSFDDRSGTQVSGTGVGHFVLDHNKATITGTANVNGTPGYRYSLVITDNGDPGGSDTVDLTVTQPGTAWKYHDSGTLGAGDAQVRTS